MQLIPYTQFQAQFLKILEKLKKGDDIVITIDDKPVAKLLPLTDDHPAWDARGGFGALKDKIWISEDFDKPLEDFEEYM